ncbi:MAG: hypothetical protein ACFBWO_15060 [Paracoccaceae bacterium]
MIDLDAGHASRTHGGESLGEEAIAFFEHAREAVTSADHVAPSTDPHEAVHRETHAGGHGD